VQIELESTHDVKTFSLCPFLYSILTLHLENSNTALKELAESVSYLSKYVSELVYGVSKALVVLLNSNPAP
jgi:hypothetical protein